jgi:hypothetical protein
LHHPDRIGKFPQGNRRLFEPVEQEISNNNQSQGWAHELEHDAESVFWLLVYWVVVAQPKDRPREYINAVFWAQLIGNSDHRDDLVLSLCKPASQNDLTHSAYKPLKALICDLASFLVVDRCWLPASDPRNNPEYLNEAFQRSILQFILDNRYEDFMNHTVGTTLRKVKEQPESQGPSSTRGLDADAAEREEKPKRPRLTFVGCECGSLDFSPFLLYSQEGAKDTLGRGFNRLRKQ